MHMISVRGAVADPGILKGGFQFQLNNQFELKKKKVINLYSYFSLLSQQSSFSHIANC